MSTVTARISEEMAQDLESLAKATNRSKSFIVARALEEFLREQSWQIARVRESLDQADAGEFATHERVREAFGKWGLNIED